jgi:hypothetical protein
MDNVYVAATTNVYSGPIDMQGLSGLAIVGICVSGSVSTTFALEGSYDLQTWAVTGISLPFSSISASPSFSSGVSVNIPYPYVRVKLTGGASATIVRVNCAAFEPN